ncbi:MAG: MBOAT family protein [Roseiarcus sp.]
MLFTQINFIFVFLPVTLIGYLLVARVIADPAAPLVWLAAASLVFYAQWKVAFLPVIVVSIVGNYCLGRLIAGQRNGAARAGALAVAVGANLLALAFYKYTNFGIEIVNHLFGRNFAPAKIVLPLGISFFTFTQIAYLADVYGGYPSERSFVKYALFVSYFPHLIAGPILHHSEMMPQFGAPTSRRFSAERTSIGLTIFALGLFKKAIIADGFALIVNPVFLAASKGGVVSMDAWGGALAYSLQIYFDFSGYCDMAIGLSLLFGIVLPFNFDSPYKARSIVEFWRRWHITLSRFLRDYLYIALGGNRRGALRRNANLLATMLLGGLWHGAGWTFVIWGGLHGVYLVVNHRWTAVVRRAPGLARFAGTIPYALLALALTQIAVVVAWVFFRADGIVAARHVLVAMAGGRGKSPPGPALVDITQLGFVAVGYLICLCLPNVNSMFAQWHVGLVTYDNPPAWSLPNFKWRLRPAWAVAAAFILVIGVVVSAVVGEGSPFLYFQF